MVDTFDIYFNREKEPTNFFYLELDLIPLDMFKVVRGDQLVEDNGDFQSAQVVTSPATNTQVDT